MKKLKKILVPLDGSKNSFRGLKFALSLAEQTDISVVGLNVISFPPILKNKEIILQKKKKSLQIINQAKNLSQKEKISFKGVIKFSENIGKTIVSLANKNKVDLIVIGSRGPDPEMDLFLGSVSNYVVNKSKTPVTVIK